uniref:Uncharacterized protein n=1 Tax=Arundo donax TaxID=35708 RepID=A0A0A9AG37_ARUDO
MLFSSVQVYCAQAWFVCTLIHFTQALTVGNSTK